MSDVIDRMDAFLRKPPTLEAEVYIARGAVVVGDVTLGARANIWYNAVLRGDINRIAVGSDTNIQDNAVLHISDDFPCIVGDRVTVGHSAVVHACTVGDECLIGMGSTILDGAVIGEHCIIGANSLVSMGRQIPPRSLVLGSPGKVVRELTEKEIASLPAMAAKYSKYGQYCLKHRINVGEPLPSGQ